MYVLLILVVLYVVLVAQLLFTITKPKYKNTRKPQNSRVVISMTTSPKRVWEIYKVINALRNQTIQPDLFFINLPVVFKRDGSKFTSIPEFLIRDNIILNFCEDLGPATKIVPTCKSDYIRPDDIIFSVDDDIYYPPELLQLFITYHIMYPNYVISGTSLFTKERPKKFGELEDCELLEGFSCVLYKKKWLSDIPLEMFDKNIVPIYHYLSDDLVLSNYLVMKGIGILTFTRPHPIIDKIRPLDYGLRDDALHKGAGGLAPTCEDGELCNSTNYIETIKFLRRLNKYHLSKTENEIQRI